MNLLTSDRKTAMSKHFMAATAKGNMTVGSGMRQRITQASAAWSTDSGLAKTLEQVVDTLPTIKAASDKTMEMHFYIQCRNRML